MPLCFLQTAYHKPEPYTTQVHPRHRPHKEMTLVLSPYEDAFRIRIDRPSSNCDVRILVVRRPSRRASSSSTSTSTSTTSTSRVPIKSSTYRRSYASSSATQPRPTGRRSSTYWAARRSSRADQLQSRRHAEKSKYQRHERGPYRGVDSLLNSFVDQQLDRPTSVRPYSPGSGPEDEPWLLPQQPMALGSCGQADMLTDVDLCSLFAVGSTSSPTATSASQSGTVPDERLRLPLELEFIADPYGTNQAMMRHRSPSSEAHHRNTTTALAEEQDLQRQLPRPRFNPDDVEPLVFDENWVWDDEHETNQDAASPCTSPFSSVHA